MIKFSILITTKDRLNDLKFTLNKLKHLIERNNVECIVCDDGSKDETFRFVKKDYPRVLLFRNEESKGLIYSRNKLLSLAKGEYAISLDDDANFITENPLEIIDDYFKSNKNCGVLAFKIYWNKEVPRNIFTMNNPKRVKSFVGCGHVWNMKVWKLIPDYPDWFIFYGEEEFASYQLFKNGWEVHYVPEILIHHRVDIKSRKNDKDYRERLRRSLRSGWYLYFLFFPYNSIPRRFAYTLWIQIKTKVFKGDFKAFIAILQAIGDVMINFSKLIENSNRFSKKEFEEYLKLPETKIYSN